MMKLIPLMIFYELISNTWLFKRNMPSHTQSSQHSMNLLLLLLTIDHPISTVKVTDNKIVFLPTMLNQKLFVPIGN